MSYTVIVLVQRRGRGVGGGGITRFISIRNWEDSLIKNFTDSKLALEFSGITVLLNFFINNEEGAHDIR
jgi:hypothetical protein